jgi:hypothetical protein
VWRGKELYTGFLDRKPEERRPLENPGVDGLIILKCVFEIWLADIDWIDLTQDRGQVAGLF